MGKTISITLPVPLVEKLQEKADIKGVSRSRFISNLLLGWQEKQEEKDEVNLGVKGTNNEFTDNL